MEKYIRTYYNDEKVIMKISGCQHCPLMKFDMSDTKCICRRFRNKIINYNIVDQFIINYTENGIVNEKIKIPNWCELSDNIPDLIKSKLTYRAFKSTILMDENDPSVDLEIIDANKLRSEGSISMDNFLIQLNGGQKEFEFENTSEDNDIKYTTFDEINNIADRHNINYGYQDQIKKQGICSLCGEDDESVKRDKNLGMCDACWDVSKYDEDKKRQAFINNFRMKRNKDFPKETFKMVDKIKIL